MSGNARPLDFAKPHVLRSVQEYRAAVREIEALLDADPRRGTEDYDRLEFLSVLVEAYEDEKFPWDEIERGGTPQSAVSFMVQQLGMTREELAPLMGGKSRVSAFFDKKTALSLSQIRPAISFLRDATSTLPNGPRSSTTSAITTASLPKSSAKRSAPKSNDERAQSRPPRRGGSHQAVRRNCAERTTKPLSLPARAPSHGRRPGICPCSLRVA